MSNRKNKIKIIPPEIKIETSIEEIKKIGDNAIADMNKNGKAIVNLILQDVEEDLKNGIFESK
jgi:hypothetical protein